MGTTAPISTRFRWVCWPIGFSFLAGCASDRAPPARAPVAAARPASPAPWDAAPKIGKPYQVFGRWYTPADDPGYDATGIASWYGPGFHARSTANGETYDQEGISAAHKTLPLPSYVEVSNLDNGRRLVVRINDRGPFVGERVIDLSRRAAQLLGVDRVGLARVRVRRVVPGADDIAALRPRASLPLLAADVPAVATTRAVAATPVTTAASDRVASVELPAPRAAPVAAGPLIQVAAVADAGRAAWLAGYLAEFGPTRIERTAGGLHRVRLGPFADGDKAAAALSRVHAAGYGEAWIIGGTIRSPVER